MSVGKFINKVGVELEGFYYILPDCNGSYVEANYGFHYDGSIKINGKKANHNCTFSFPTSHPKSIKKKYDEFAASMKDKSAVAPLEAYFRVGEVVSPPLKSQGEVVNFIKNCWPDKTNRTGALHFHLSFNKDSYYSCLMENKFGVEFRESLRNFVVENDLNSVIKSRVFNECDHSKYYCKDNFIPLKQIFVEQKIWHENSPDRYTILNFCYGLHKTMECRVFSTHAPVKSGLLCWKWLFEFVENYLENNYSDFCKQSDIVQVIEHEVSDNLLSDKEENSETDIIYVN